MKYKHGQQLAAMSGFSLIELAIVLIVIGVLSRTALVPVSTMIERSRVSHTAELLERTREVLIGHLISGGTLPCPVASSRTNLTTPAARTTSTTRTNSHPVRRQAATARPRSVECRLGQGLLPVSLGIAGPVDATGRTVDAWGQPLHYAVSLSSSEEAGELGAPDWTTAGEVQAVGVRGLDADLELCLAASNASCPARIRRGDRIVAVIWSRGRDVSTAGNQSENQDGDQTFAVTAPSVNSDEPFDDQLVWVSTLEAKYWLLRSGWLP